MARHKKGSGDRGCVFRPRSRRRHADLRRRYPFSLLSNIDEDGLSNKIEIKITRTDPLDADTENDRIDDGDEDVNEEGVDAPDET